MPNILVVDDSPAILQMLRTALSGAGYRVTTASDGESAVRLCLAERFDTVLSDVDMPAMSGCELARWLAVRYPETRFVLMSGCQTSCNECPYSPRCTLVRKPFGLGELIQIVKRPRDGGIRSQL